MSPKGRLLISLVFALFFVFAPSLSSRMFAAENGGGPTGISGIVTDISANPISNISAVAYQMVGNPAIEVPHWEVISSAISDSDGAYTMTVPSAGSYRVQFIDNAPLPRYASEYYLDANSPWTALEIVVRSNNITSGIDAQMQPGSTIAGKVTDFNGNPLGSDVGVTAYIPEDDGSGTIIWKNLVSTNPTSNGLYTLTIAYSGTVRLGFGDASPVGIIQYQPEYYDDLRVHFPIMGTEINGAKDISVTIGALVSGIDANLNRLGMIEGTVTNSASEPITNVAVFGYREMIDGSGTATWVTVGQGAMTDNNGHYQLFVLEPGDVRICFNKQYNYTNYLPTCYGSNDDPATATALSSDWNVIHSNIDIQLAAMGIIKGRIIDTAGNPIFAATATAYLIDPPYGAFNQRTSNENGEFVISGLLPGVYRIGAGADPAYYESEWYDNVADFTQATSVTIGADEILTFTFELASKAVISGFVNDTDGTPLAAIGVTAYHFVSDGNGGGSWQAANGATTATDGNYLIPSLSAGIYRVGFNGGSDYTSEFYQAAETVENALDITVGSGGTITNVNATLRSARSVITGTVSNQQGQALQGIHVSLYQPSGASYTNWAATTEVETDESGHYTFTNLLTGAYRVAFVDSPANIYLPQFYNGAVNIYDATTIDLPSGSTFGNVNAQLKLAGRIRGRVTTTNGHPASGIKVFISPGLNFNDGFVYPLTVQADEDGNYEFAPLPANSYQICFSDEFNSGGYVAECYPNKPPAQADPIVLTDEQLLEQVDGIVTDLAKISGKVTNSNGDGIGGVQVTLPGASAVTADDGTYVVRGLSTGSYWIQYQAVGYTTRFYKNVEDVANSTPVSVTVDSIVENIDVVLLRTAQVKGRVTDTQNNPIPGISVGAVKVSNNPWTPSVPAEMVQYAAATTDQNGEYTLDGVDANNAYVLFADPNYPRQYQLEYFQDSPDLSGAKKIELSEGQSITGVDATLDPAKTLLTIILDTVPDSKQNIRFDGDLGEFQLDDAAPDDGDVYSNTITFQIEPGTYALNELIPMDRFLLTVLCGAANNDSNTATGKSMITVQRGDHGYCTFANARAANLHVDVYDDVNGNGIKDGDGEALQPGWTININNIYGHTLFSQVTGEDGAAHFYSVYPDEYLVCLVLSTDKLNTQPGGELNAQFNQPCYTVKPEGGQVANVRFGNTQAIEGKPLSDPSTASNSIELFSMPSDEDNFGYDPYLPRSTYIYLPLVSKQE